MRTPHTHPEERARYRYIVAGPERIGNAYGWPCVDIPGGIYVIAETRPYETGGSGPCIVDGTKYYSQESALTALWNDANYEALQERDDPPQPVDWMNTDERLAS